MTCSACGAAMAEDQRYCLNCGQRRGESRVEFRRYLGEGARAGSGEPAAPAVEPAPAAPEPPHPQRDYAPLAAAGGIAVLGAMLLIGVLIGRGAGSGNEQAAAPQVIRVDAAQGAAAGGGQGAAGAGRAGKGDQGKKARKAKAGTGKAPVASDAQLQQLQEKTGEEYSKESAKLPNEIATPGAPPPTDGKTPGGGSAGTTIE